MKHAIACVSVSVSVPMPMCVRVRVCVCVCVVMCMCVCVCMRVCVCAWASGRSIMCVLHAAGDMWLWLCVRVRTMREWVRRVKIVKKMHRNVEY